MTTSRAQQELEALEIELLLEAVFRHYGFDFREYAPASLQRRIANAIQAEGVKTVSGLQERVLHDPACLERFLLALSVNVTAMFRDPEFYLAFRRRVVPILRTYPSIQIWHAGCASGEEVYSMAILLEEEGLAPRARLYATDMNDSVLQQARAGIFPLEYMKDYTSNYLSAGGKRSFSDYYTAGYGNAIFRAALRENVTFAQHNLVTDGAFNTFHVIWCRNVTIYFKKSLQRRVHNLLYDSLIMLGILGLGSKETIQATPHEGEYDVLVPGEKLYRKVR
ncbi:MAG TPA: protein-glutamate O-methyltransferase CheR [Chloroflexia bacterium]|nr:protein-glutamate O-methyltransferase CheR [Chloroflexia bacterium]